jgi:hypothetical protein
MGMTATPNPSSPATPVTSCPPSEYSIVGADSISQAHPADARPVDPDAGPISIVGTDGALRL